MSLVFTRLDGAAGAGDQRSRRTAAATLSRGGALRPGFGLLIGAGVSVALWAGLAKLALNLLH